MKKRFPHLAEHLGILLLLLMGAVLICTPKTFDGQGLGGFFALCWATFFIVKLWRKDRGLKPLSKKYIDEELEKIEKIEQGEK